MIPKEPLPKQHVVQAITALSTDLSSYGTTPDDGYLVHHVRLALANLAQEIDARNVR